MTSNLGSLAYKSWKLTKIMPNSLKLLYIKKNSGPFSSRVFETKTATGSELFSLLTCFHATTFTLLSIFSPLAPEMIRKKIWETPLTWHAKFSLSVAVRVSKTRVLKLPIAASPTSNPGSLSSPPLSSSTREEKRESLGSSLLRALAEQH